MTDRLEPILIRGGTVVTPDALVEADVAVAGGIVEAVGRGLSAKGRRVLRAAGRLILPGAIDAHTHMQLPMQGFSSADDFESGTRAAALGGVTTIIDFAAPARDGGVLRSLRERRAEAEGRTAVDFGLHACLAGWSKKTAAEVPRAIEAGAPSFKMFTVYRERGMLTEDGELFEALEEVTRRGGLVTLHAENAGLVEALTRRSLQSGRGEPLALADSRPNLAEAEAVQRAVTLAEAAQARLYIVHLSTREGLEAVVRGQQRGVEVVAETCPQYLLLDRSALERPTGARFTCVPPLRTPADGSALWDGLGSGAVAIVATDHCPFRRAQKDAARRDFTKLPLGLPGVETLLPLLHGFGVGGGLLTLQQLVRVTSLNPALVFGLYPRKGLVAPGADADLVLFDPERPVTLAAARLHMRTDYSPYEGLQVRGWPETVLLRGRVVVDHGRYVGRPGDGRYVQRQPWAPGGTARLR